jgi:hypothetical protein
MTLTEELMTTVLTATNDRKIAALRILQGNGHHADNQLHRSMAGQAEPFLTLRECGRRLGLSACSLWRWGVPGHELGGRRKFRMTEVEAYLQSEEFRRKVAGLRKAKALSGRQVAVASGQGRKTVAA